MLLVFRIHRDESHSVSYILASGKRIFSLVCPSQGVNPQYLLHWYYRPCQKLHKPCVRRVTLREQRKTLQILWIKNMFSSKFRSFQRVIAQNALQREWGNFPFANWNGICWRLPLQLVQLIKMPFLPHLESLTLGSGIKMPPGINVPPGTFDKRNKRVPWKIDPLC